MAIPGSLPNPEAVWPPSVPVAATNALQNRLTQILRGGRGKDLLAAGHHRLDSHAQLAHRTEAHVLGAIDGLIAEGTLESTGGRYPLVRRTHG